MTNKTYWINKLYLPMNMMHHNLCMCGSTLKLKTKIMYGDNAVKFAPNGCVPPMKRSAHTSMALTCAQKSKFKMNRSSTVLSHQLDAFLFPVSLNLSLKMHINCNRTIHFPYISFLLYCNHDFFSGTTTIHF